MIRSYSKIKTDRNYNEDFKTYATLGVLQVLPAQFFWQLLREAVIGNQDLPIHTGIFPQYPQIHTSIIRVSKTYERDDVPY